MTTRLLTQGDQGAFRGNGHQGVIVQVFSSGHAGLFKANNGAKFTILATEFIHAPRNVALAAGTTDASGALQTMVSEVALYRERIRGIAEKAELLDKKGGTGNVCRTLFVMVPPHRQEAA